MTGLGARSSGLATDVANLSRLHGLSPRDDAAEPGWTFWEQKSLNRHRVIGLLRQIDRPRGADDLEHDLREAIARHFRRAWWRGLAGGVVAELPLGDWGPQAVASQVDVRERDGIVIQWVLLADPAARRAIGVHTWAVVSLTPIYVAVASALSLQGWEVRLATRSKDGLLRLLTDAAAIRGVGIPEMPDVRLPGPPEDG